MIKRLLILVFLLTLFVIRAGFSQSSSPILSEPPNLDQIVPVSNETFGWQDLTGILSYTIQFAQDPNFNTLTNDGYTVTTNSFTTTSGMLSPMTTYYWRVRGNYADSVGPFSAVWSFTTAGTPSQEVGSLEDNVNTLVAGSELSATQGNILNNKLGQAQHQFDLNHPFNGDLHLALFDVRVFVLVVSGQLSYADGTSLINFSDAIINLTGLRKPIAVNGLAGKTFALNQNYPNPFNPTTNIEYSIPDKGFVTLKVYDITGKVVSTLVNKDQDAGSYIVTWNASALSSGVYFYKLVAGTYTETKKMVLNK